MKSKNKYPYKVLERVNIVLRHIFVLFQNWQINWGKRRTINALYVDLLAPISAPQGKVLIADGLWDNPNHFFRLFIYLRAIDPNHALKRIAFVNSKKSSPQRLTLKALGFTEFIEVDSRPEKYFLDIADRLLGSIKTHDDFLDLKLPLNLPAYIVYDAALKIARHPQPSLDSPCWRIALARALSALNVASEFIKTHEIKEVVLSHPWGIPYGVIAWASIISGIKTSHITGYNEGIRIRRFLNLQDFSVPVEHLTYENYLELSDYSKQALSKIGVEQFLMRKQGTSTDINSRSAFIKVNRLKREQARTSLIANKDGPVVLICAHVWFDFPHTFSMKNFTDFYDWMKLTIEVISEVKEITWLLKPHPTEKWYGGFMLEEMLSKNHSNIILLPHDFDQASAIEMSDALVTVHGTAGIEGAMNGLPILCADRGYYSDWPFVTLAESREAYIEFLQNINNLNASTEETKRAASACFAAALSSPNNVDKRMATVCDSRKNSLYINLIHDLSVNWSNILSEQKLIEKWNLSHRRSYGVYVLESAINDPAVKL